MATGDLEYSVKDLSAALWAAELYHGQDLGDLGSVPSQDSDRYMYERSAISGALIARTVESTVVPDGSLTGFRFKEPLPSSVTDAETLCGWVQETNQKQLDAVIESDPKMAKAANRYQDLVWVNGQKQGDRTSSPRARRKSLKFQQAIEEPLAWLKTAAVVGHYHGASISHDQALPFVVGQLTVMQTAARKDVSKQYVRGAIAEALSELGEMRNAESRKDTEFRYRILKMYVAVVTGHQLTAATFKNLYSVEPDQTTGIRLRERPQGFGRIPAVRENPLGCPASYKLLRGEQRDERRIAAMSALNRLLRASITALQEADLLGQYVATSRTYVPLAFERLQQKVVRKKLEAAGAQPALVQA